MANKDRMKPAEVVKKVQTLLGNPKSMKYGEEKDKFNSDTHTRCWKKYNVRPANNSANPELTDSKYCIYDSLNKNYGYTDEWVDFLVEELVDEEKFNELYT